MPETHYTKYQVTTKDLADLWQVDMRMVQYYADKYYMDGKNEEPLPRVYDENGKVVEGIFDLMIASKWMFKRQKKENTRSKESGEESLNKAKEHGVLIKNKKEETAYQMLVGQLVDRNHVAIIFSNLSNVIRNNVQTSYNDLRRDVEPLIEDEEKRFEFYKIINDSENDLNGKISKTDIKKYIVKEDEIFNMGMDDV